MAKRLFQATGNLESVLLLVERREEELRNGQQAKLGHAGTERAVNVAPVALDENQRNSESTDSAERPS